MTPVLEIQDLTAQGIDQAGGKAFCLANLYEQGIRVPPTFCIPCRVYENYLVQTRSGECV